MRIPNAKYSKALKLSFFCLFLANLLNATKYPVVLIHGLFGFAENIGELSYWGDVEEALKAHGNTVFLASISQAHTSEMRGEQLKENLLSFGYEKYHLIGHSQGGLDARYVLERYPNLVASVTTIGTPHHGSLVADELARYLSLPFSEIFVPIMGDMFAYAIGFLAGSAHDQDTVAAISALTTHNMKMFNHRYRIGIGSYCSEGENYYAGRPLYSWGSSIGAEVSAGLYRSIFDTIGNTIYQEPNDGLVAVCSMKFGKWLGAIPNAHHLIPVGGVGELLNGNDKRRIINQFVRHMERLANLGL